MDAWRSAAPVALILVLGTASEGAGDDAKDAPSPRSEDAGFVALRAPVLGFTIERNAGSGRHRLVKSPDQEARGTVERQATGGTVLLVGSLEECEERLVEELRKRYGNGNLNLPAGTLGGKQFWADREVLSGWRIQENVFTGHHRLLDPSEVRQAWGSYESCRAVLEAERVRRRLRPRSDHLVLVVHGLGRSRDSFAKLSQALAEAGYEVAAVNYPSTRRDPRRDPRRDLIYCFQELSRRATKILVAEAKRPDTLRRPSDAEEGEAACRGRCGPALREHSLQLRGVLDRMQDVRTVSFVTHSLGGIVVRDLLSLEGSWKERIRPGRVVMIAPPSQGSIVAEVLNDWMPARAVMGKVLGELTPAEVAAIPPPSCEFGIIAGGTGGAKGLNPLLEGDNDGVVTVESTRLEGSRDFLLLDATHTFIMTRRECIEATLRFLREGRFTAAEKPGSDRR